MWRGGNTLFEGTPEEWREVKDTPEKLFQDIPANWDTIVAHVDSFLAVLVRSPRPQGATEGSE